MTIIDKLIWEIHCALKAKDKKAIQKVQKELLDLGYVIENSYTLSKLDEAGYQRNVNIPFLEARFKNYGKGITQ